ncbi:hypothetical protein IAG25_35630 [Caballeronia sp. EK]|uniref:hypothetical protein n=1 Tax=Caballeronia sp. EK TaxID=2767469 RepID=UPI001655F2FE|nr:hypothetical protein [Caballeronia sp. EK]MBC8642139.1 hypothetical protein [Caballeronia sp. EK]
MALKKSATYKTLEIPAAYYRVVLPQIELSGNSMSFGVWMYPSQDAAADSNNMLSDAAVSYNGVSFNVAGADPFTQAYAYLKTLPEFEDAVDV